MKTLPIPELEVAINQFSYQVHVPNTATSEASKQFPTYTKGFSPV